jgi:Asp-tRNA(Asn)/Glu-tRNA(Gln) amidotransferase A subunit family amidase
LVTGLGEQPQPCGRGPCSIDYAATSGFRPCPCAILRSLYARSTATSAPMARTVEDAALLLQPSPATTPPISPASPSRFPDYRAALTGDIGGLKVGIRRSTMWGPLDDEVRRRRRRAHVFADLGPRWSRSTFPTTCRPTADRARRLLLPHLSATPGRASIADARPGVDCLGMVRRGQYFAVQYTWLLAFPM